ncbi:MAG: type III pantothenate kinase [Candidatus Latescibacterota bacterium]|nr:MAG: type III pantothenate kinase [Candidatus Latescibacterota bacterium]
MSARGARLASDLLAVDVGNSKVQAVLYLAGDERFRGRVEYDGAGRRPWSRAWADAVRVVRELAPARTRVVVSSVAPRRARVVEAALRRAGLRRLHRVAWDDRWPFRLDVLRPETLGVDRLANVAGVMADAERSAVVVDAGTAVTVDLLERGHLRGGLILPGFHLMARALHAHTAQLPLVDASGYAPPFGDDTASALRAGIQSTLAHGLRGIVTALRRRLGPRAPVVFTGGHGERLGNLARLAEARVEPDLLFRGLRLLAHRLR